MEGIIQGVTAVIAGGLGVVVGLVAALAFRLSDRAQQREAESEPGALDEGLVRVLSVLRSAAVVIDDDDDVVRASPPAYALGVVRNDALAHETVVELVHEVRRDGVIRERELELPRGPIGSGTVLLQVRAAPLGMDNILVLAEDRTEARRVEAIRRDFVVNVSHELKTPVGALALLAETVQDAADDPEAVRRFTERMQSEAHRLSELVHEIIELSRLQVAGALQQIEPVSVVDVVDEAVDRARTKAQGKNIAITVGGTSESIVFGDHNLLVTAVRNLLDNAVSYSGENTRVGVGVHERDGLVEIDVVDQGVGISTEEQQRVFERFYRVDPARSRDTGGTGLGLSIVKHVAADHGGDVRVWSEPGKGSTFTLRIPAADLAAGALDASAATPDGGPSDDRPAGAPPDGGASGGSTDGSDSGPSTAPGSSAGGPHRHGAGDGPRNEEVSA
ncbi:ATP-binding protein [Isoptericola sp. b515]|uniref:sensor histidine kinase n=1 Tax=Isoptericola sp. b515 TaxID=3064652 RepID=UPI0027140707|nr:ATP-binding protein [Isoptericola sp. b515]MDO8149305.1 ATP-binding protein [Isoptericola sp. b515]